MRQLLVIGIVLTSLWALSGCVTYSAGVASSTRPLTPGEYTVLNTTQGTSWGINFLGLPLKQSRTSAALAEAIKDSGGDSLIQVAVDNRSYGLLILYLQRVKVEGLGVRSAL